MLVSAIVSTYNSERFIASCLEDLIAQSLYKKGLLEIVVVDSASLENEEKYVQEYKKQNKNIKYIKLKERVGLYEAWNIGIKESSGIFLTNANTDDRHNPICLEMLSDSLIKNTNIDLVYADVYATKNENTKFSESLKDKRYFYKAYFAPEVLLHYQFGCQPMWRKEVHEKIGYFNTSLKAAGDYEFNIRFALAGLKALHIKKALGLFLENESSISQKDSTSTNEQIELRKNIITVGNILKLYQNEGFDISDNKRKAHMLHSLALKALEYELPWHPNESFFDTEVAFCCFIGAIELTGNNPVLLNNFAVLLQKMGQLNDCERLMLQISNQNLISELNRNIEKVKNKTLDKNALELSYQLT